jgi:hypothetical protein
MDILVLSSHHRTKKCSTASSYSGSGMHLVWFFSGIPRVHITLCPFSTAHCPLVQHSKSAHYPLPTLHCPQSTLLCSLSMAYFPLLTGHCPLATVYCSLFIARCPLPIVKCLLPIVYCPLSIVLCPLPILRPTGRCPLTNIHSPVSLPLFTSHCPMFLSTPPC